MILQVAARQAVAVTVAAVLARATITVLAVVLARLPSAVMHLVQPMVHFTVWAKMTPVKTEHIAPTTCIAVLAIKLVYIKKCRNQVQLKKEHRPRVVFLFVLGVMVRKAKQHGIRFKNNFPYTLVFFLTVCYTIINLTKGDDAWWKSKKWVADVEKSIEAPSKD